MRIAIFTESYHPVVNGVAVAVRWLASALRPEHTVVIYAPRFPGHIDDEADVVRLPSYRLPQQPGYPFALPWSPGAFGRFAAERFDVVHTHSPFTLGHTGRRWARRLRLPLVTTYHTLYVEYAHYAAGIPTAPTRAFLRSLSRSYCNACDQVAVPTEPIRAVLREYGVRRPVAVIPTGLPPRPPVAPDPSYPRAAFGIPAAAPLVLYAGRLAREKNLELLFGAFARVAAAAPTARLLIAGSGPMEADARLLAARAGVAAQTTFAGFLSQDLLRRCYAAADAFAFTSLTDTQGLVIAEARAAGLPVVSVDAYGPGTVVRNEIDGFLVPNDAPAFAAGLLRILQEPGLQARFRAAAVEDRRFRIESTAASYLELYAAARAVHPSACAAPEKGAREGA
jgi:glycosyltransferase involved in cell wall biosynthesis